MYVYELVRKLLNYNQDLAEIMIVGLECPQEEFEHMEILDIDYLEEINVVAINTKPQS